MWRSLLFVPTLEERFVAKAGTRGADALVLDLEASIAPDRKDEARKALPEAVNKLSADLPVTVRINPLWMAAIKDLEASVLPGVEAIHIAQCESAEQVRVIDRVVSDLEAQRSLPAGGIKLIALLESASAMTEASAIAAASPRLCGLTLGVEDYATSMGVSTSRDLLRPAVYQLNQAAKAAHIASFAVPASIADFSDVASLRAEAQYARNIGTVGGYAVHPAQIQTLNEVFVPSLDELQWAKDVLEAARMAEQQGQAVFKVGGQMIDLPLIVRAQHFLDVANRTN